MILAGFEMAPPIQDSVKFRKLTMVGAWSLVLGFLGLIDHRPLSIYTGGCFWIRLHDSHLTERLIMEAVWSQTSWFELAELTFIFIQRSSSSCWYDQSASDQELLGSNINLAWRWGYSCSWLYLKPTNCLNYVEFEWNWNFPSNVLERAVSHIHWGIRWTRAVISRDQKLTTTLSSI